jgi:hypothetical protein
MTRELDSRSSDGIRVRLLWHPHDDQLSVAVDDTKTGESFELRVGAGEAPLDVFHHPYAYAARNDSRIDAPTITPTDTLLAARPVAVRPSES